MLTNTFKALDKNSVEENFYGKEKINILTTFFHFL